MSTTVGTIKTEGMSDHTIEVYVGVQHVVLFIQNGFDREGKGTKLLLDERKWNELQDYLEIAGRTKEWRRE